MFRKIIIVLAVLSLIVYGLIAWGIWRSAPFVRHAIARVNASGRPAIEVGRVTQSFALGTRTHLIVNAPGDKVQVRPGKALRVTAVQYAYPEPGQPTPRPKHPLRVDGAEAGPTEFRVSVERESGYETHDLRTDLVIEAPPAVSVEVHAEEGDVDITDRTGAVSVSSGAGNVTVTRGRGPVTVENSAGNVTVTSSQGAVTVHLSAGNVIIHDAVGALRLSNRAGNIELQNVRSTDIEADNSMGNIDIALSSPFTGRLVAHNSMGNVTVSLPRASRVRVETHAGMGDTENSLPAEVTHGNPSGKLEVSTSMGNVELKASD
jgi:hypothetical protein